MVSNLFYPLNSRGKQHKNMSGWVFVTVDGLFFSSHWHKVELALRRSGGRLWEKGPFRKDKFNKMLGWRYHFQTAQCWWLLRFVRGEKRKNWFTFSWGYTGKGGGCIQLHGNLALKNGLFCVSTVVCVCPGSPILIIFHLDAVEKVQLLKSTWK